MTLARPGGAATVAARVLLVAALVLAMCASLAAGAPAPFHKQRSPSTPDVTGVWVMEWAGTVYRAEFGTDGSYACVTLHLNGGVVTTGTAVYKGAYRVKGQTIYVVESYEGKGSPIHWKVTVGHGMTGGNGSDRGQPLVVRMVR
jgi:hypothetical protein